MQTFALKTLFHHRKDHPSYRVFSAVSQKPILLTHLEDASDFETVMFLKETSKQANKLRISVLGQRCEDQRKGSGLSQITWVSLGRGVECCKQKNVWLQPNTGVFQLLGI